MNTIFIELEKLRHKHYTNDEDCWYSCPKSGECCNSERDNDECTCGADTYNEILDQVIQKIKTQIASIKRVFTNLMKDHCCKYACKCEKTHLYCGFEMEHGIELQEVIDLIKEWTGENTNE